MKSTRDKDIIANYIEGSKIYFGIAAFLLFLFFVIGQYAWPDERDVTKSDCRVFETEWQQVLENGERIPVDLPGNVPAEYGEVITFTTTLPQEINDRENLCFRVIWQDVAIYIDGELRQSYTTEDTRPFGTNSAMRYVFVELYEEDAGKELTYQVSSNSKYAGEMRTSYIGDQSSIWFHFVRESGARAVISLLLMLLSLFCIIVCAILKYLYKRTLSLNYLAWTLFYCALWMLSETEFRQILFKNISVLSAFTYWSLMMIPFSLLIYINDIQKRRYEKVYIGPLIYSCVILVVCTLLQVFDIVQFVEQLPFIHGGIAVAIVCAITTITIDFIKRQASDYLFVGIGIYGMLLTAVIEIILYYMKSSTSLGTFLSIGLLFLLMMAIIKTGQDMFQSEKKKQQAIMATRAQAQFLANMSHEIRTPINAVIGLNEMILRENENDIIREYAQNIQRSSNMLLGLVNDVLDFSKIESGQLELVEGSYHLASLIQDEKLLLNTRANGKALSTLVEVDSNLPSKLFGDELRIKQILTNLLSNAVKYTREGSVTLKISFQWINDDTIELRFDVTDTGIGIKQEDLTRLFDSFKRLELSRNRDIEGTGLGLNIAKSLVELMQGDILVESEYGKGSTFTVTIPQKVLDKKPIGNLEEAVREYRKENKASDRLFTAPEASVLVVDDNAMNLSVMEALLKRTKMQVEFASGGKECLELSKHKSYDIILMDHMMPELDGIETLKLLRADNRNLNRNTIVIALTANAIAGCKEMYLTHGFNDYFAKPIQADKLDALLIRYLPDEKVHMETVTRGEGAGTDRSNREQRDNVTVAGESVRETFGSVVSDENVQKTGSGATVPDENVQNTDSRAMVPDENTSQTTKSTLLVEAALKRDVEDLLFIDKDTGISYCGDSEELYKEILLMFCEQCPEYLSLLKSHFQKEEWKHYAMIAHTLKGNALNIGATKFSKLSLEHEMAGKAENAEFIRAEYENYIMLLKALVEKIEEMMGK